MKDITDPASSTAGFRLYKEFFRALGNATRFRIVQLLREGPCNVGQIAESLGLEQSRVSHSLACLLNCGFVVWNWEGKNKLYRLNPELTPILGGIDRHLTRFASQLDSCQVLGQELPPVVVVAGGIKTETRSRSRRRDAGARARSKR
jgi:DNA-binding transcriptional ArsR family regulator